MEMRRLRSRYRSEPDPHVRERLLMVIWLKEGSSTYEVARLLKCPQSKVMYWKARYIREGIGGLATRPRPGKPRRLAAVDEVRIKAGLQAQRRWRTRDVAELIQEVSGLRYSMRHVIRLLHSWGFVRVRGAKGAVAAGPGGDGARRSGGLWARPRRASLRVEGASGAARDLRPQRGLAGRRT